MTAELALVIGGARSGKSGLAERLVRHRAGALPPVYLATAGDPAGDAEMAARIAAHREARGPGWITRECGVDPGPALAEVAPGQAVLVDCATLWLGAVLLSGPGGATLEPEDVDAAVLRLLDALGRCRGPVTVVSNEVGQGIVPDNALARRFRDAQGRLNQRLAARADLVVTVIAGLPLVLKGRLPGNFR
jgi:adenosylcobinamide kinase / adenosylcobinamide-phosphate guanylyltransferase